MKKPEFVEKLGIKIGMSASDADRILTAFQDLIYETLKAGDDVRLHGFGMFYTIQRKPGKSIHPDTKEQVETPGGTTPKFSAGRAFKDAVSREVKNDNQIENPPAQPEAESQDLQYTSEDSAESDGVHDAAGGPSDNGSADQF